MKPIATREQFQVLYMAVGALTVHWGILEAFLNNTIIIIFRAAGGHHIEAELPLMFRRKVKFLRRCFRSVAALAEYRDEALLLLERLSRLAPTRQVLSHGSFRRVSDDGLSYHFDSSQPDKPKTNLVRAEHAFSVDQMADASKEALDLSRDFGDLIERLYEAFVGEYPNESLPSDL